MTTTTVNGRPALRFERRLAHSRDKVWRAVTDPVHLNRWYPLTVTEMDPRRGGLIVFDDGEGTLYKATITDFDPPRLFAFDEHDPAGGARDFDDHMRIELFDLDEGGCRLVFTHVLTDPATAEGAAEGWRRCLDLLVAAADRV
ncbi:SRPBCC domain-containing protein [Rhizohabitans arisaemae]|uniref:SRPBCC domain-containing protein n=1 Tax=Rhizohabitans arisaemae TaxID=2720610 RepID=UPI0024B192BC|nr:SRPBCC domain-containing protein [Rhizohabitans arisaemae]